jgi:hypothetical protein
MVGLLSHPLGLFVLYRILFGNGNGGGGDGGLRQTPAVSKAPFPTVAPDELPPWPQGWCPDLPPPPEVQARGWALLAQLWGKGEGSKQTEMTGGRWITYVAEMQSGQKAVGAYRSINCEAVSVVVPTAPPIPAPPPVAPPADPAAKALLDSAIAMNESLKVRGYKQADMRLYKDFQTKAKLSPVDGYPGTNTMLKLEVTLKNAGQQMAPVRVYPWKSTGGYDGVNAPTSAEWYGTAIPATSPIHPPPVATSPAPAAAPAKAVPPVVVPAAYVAPAPVNPPAVATVLDAAKAMNGMLLVRGYKQADMTLYKAFQQKAGLSPVDGFPGIGTMGKLEIVLQQAGIPIAPVKVYPWRSTGGYDGVNAPTTAEWYGTSSPATPAPAIIPATYVQAPSPMMQSAPPGASALQSAAVAMNNALILHGYRLYDQAIYKAFQRAAGSSVPDGFPGTSTMGKLQSALSTLGLPLANVPIYPWKATGGYDGKNAPLASDWTASRGIAA